MGEDQDQDTNKRSFQLYLLHCLYYRTFIRDYVCIV